MYPPETSLIPVTVSLLRHIDIHGWQVMFENYPFWYLGTTPFYYLTGPVVPVFGLIVHNLFSVPFFPLVTVFIFLSFIASVAEWLILVNKVNFLMKNHQAIKNIQGIALVGFLIIFPLRYLTAFAAGEASVVIARNLLPFGLISFWSVIGNPNKKNYVYAVLVISVLLLIHTTVLFDLIIGFISLALAKSFRKGKVNNIGTYIKIGFVVLLVGCLLSTFWYTPGYWWKLLVNPSIGGVSGVKVILRVFDFLKGTIPLVMAVFSVYFFGKLKYRLNVFVLVWTLSYFLFSAFRFIANPVFWMDWTSWFYGVEIGLAVFLATVIARSETLRISDPSKIGLKVRPLFIFLVIIFTFPFIVTFKYWDLLDKPSFVNASPPGVLKSLEMLNEVAEDDLVFISGSGVFWVNAFYDIMQVRGGNDRVSVHSSWIHDAYLLRESQDEEKINNVIKRLEISYILVHTGSSSEYYKDFTNTSIYDILCTNVSSVNGDIIYNCQY